MQTGKCPHCGESDYIVMSVLYSPTRMMDGIAISIGHKVIYKCRCMNCGKMFSFMPQEDEDGYKN